MKKLNVVEFSEGLEPVIIEAIAAAINDKVHQYIFDNNCIDVIKANTVQHDDNVGPCWNVRCFVDFERLVLPTAVNPFYFCKDQTTRPFSISHHMAKEFVVRPYVNGAMYVHDMQLDFVKEDLIKQAILYVATHVYKLITNKASS